LSRAVERADSEECARLAHGLTGACGNVGAVTLATLFYSLEREASHGDLSRCRRRLDCVRDELEQLRRAADAI
jgi:HPt (histidine-containing phosphotransfer) domain-containing protein